MRRQVKDMSELPLEGKVAIITGGGTGIGKAIALEFANAGADVVVASRRLEVLEQAAEEVRALGGRSLAIQTDVARKMDVENLVKKTVDEFGAIDILVNNAGVGGGKPILESSEVEWDQIIDIDLKGYYLCCQAAGKKMMEQMKGNIINVSSDGGFSTCRGYSSPYSVAKAGVIMLTRCLAWELAPYNIRVNSLAPGNTVTEMTRRWWSDPEILKESSEKRPLGRFAEPREMGTIALFLASDASSFMTGETIRADGGLAA